MDEERLGLKLEEKVARRHLDEPWFGGAYVLKLIGAIHRLREDRDKWVTAYEGAQIEAIRQREQRDKARGMVDEMLTSVLCRAGCPDYADGCGVGCHWADTCVWWHAQQTRGWGDVCTRV